MNKLEMAHEMACAMMASNDGYTIGGAIECAWEYADAMQKEWDEREDEDRPKVLQDEWQPDWSQAPDGFDWFCVGSRSRINADYLSYFLGLLKAHRQAIIGGNFGE